MILYHHPKRNQTYSIGAIGMEYNALLRESEPRGFLLSLRQVQLFHATKSLPITPILYNAFLNIAVNQQLDLLVIIGGWRPVAAQRKWIAIETVPR